MNAPTEADRARLQELLHHLDNSQDGTTCLAWYGQNRAQGMDHAEAMEDTILQFRLRDRPWWAVRFPEEG